MKGTIRERSPGGWEIALNIGRDGQDNRRRHSYTFKGNKTQAQRRMREMVADYDRGLWPPESIRLADWLAPRMDEHIRHNRSIATIEHYGGIIERHINPYLGHRDLDKVTPLHVQAWHTALIHKGIHRKSIGLFQTVLSGAYRHALRLDIASRNPASAVSSPSVKGVEMYIPPVADVKLLLDLADAEYPKYAPCIHLLAYTGLRLGEALALTWDDVDLDEGHLTVNQSLGRRKAGLVMSPPKTDKSNRRVDLDESTVQLLRNHWRQQQSDRAELAEDWTERNAVFPHASGDWLDPARITWTIKTLAGRIGLPQMTSHSLRHFHATVLLQAGENIVVVSQRLGHAKVSITLNMYGHVLPGWQKQAAEAFAEAMASDGDGEAAA